MADATGWIGQDGTKSWEEDGEENQKKGYLKKDFGKKTDQEKPHVQTARIIAFIEHRWDETDIPKKIREDMGIFLDAMKSEPVDLKNLGINDQGLESILDELRRLYSRE